MFQYIIMVKQLFFLPPITALFLSYMKSLPTVT